MPIRCVETQYLTIAGARGVGLGHAGDTLEFTSEDQGPVDIEERGLRPLLVVAVTVPAFQFRYRQLIDPASPRALSEILKDAWSQTSRIGMPRILEMNSSVAALDRGFIGWVESQGIEATIATRNMKSLSSVQGQSAISLNFSCKWNVTVEQKESTTVTLADGNAGLAQHDLFAMEHTIMPSMVQLNAKSFLDRGQRYCTAPTAAGDWAPTEVVLDTRKAPKPHLSTSALIAGHEPPPGLQDLLAQWPGGRGKFLSSLGISISDVDFWLQGRARLEEVQEYSLFSQLRISLNDYDEYELEGGYLILADGKTSFKRLYEELSSGGDLRFSHEMLGPEGQTHALRILVFASWGGLLNVALFRRDGKAESLLDKHQALINLRDPVQAPEDVWDSLSAVADNYLKFPHPETVGVVLEERHQSWFDSLEHL